MKSHFSLPSLLRLKNETPAVQAALAAAPLALVGAAALGAWWLFRQKGQGRGEGPSGDWLRRVVMSGELETEGHELLRYIRDTLKGLDRRSVRRLLGEPAAVSEGGGLIYEEPPRPRQETADFWYYRLGSRPGGRGSALVIEFDERDRTSDARFLVRPA